MNHPDDAGFDGEVTLLDVPYEQDGADPLSFFDSESENLATDRTDGGSSEAPAVAALTRVRGPIALDQVLHRLGHVEWAEAVAIVECLCGVLNARGSLRVPELSRVAITAEGTLAVGTAGAKDAVGPLLARMLHVLAAAGYVPAPLRLFVTKWASANEAHSIDEFAKELAYFARPEGEALIQAVYVRAVSTVPVPVRPRAETPREVPPKEPPAEEPPPEARPEGPNARLQYGASAAVVLLGIAVTALFAWRGAPAQSDQYSASNSSGVLQFNSEPIAVQSNNEPIAVQSNSEGVAESVSLGFVTGSGGVPVPGGPTAPEPRPSGVPASPRPAARLTPVQAGPPPAARPRVSEPSGIPAPVSSEVRASLASPIAPSPRSVAVPPAAGNPVSRAVRLNPTRAPRRDGALGPPVYSRSDPDVTPPVILHPQLPAQILSGLRQDMNTIELIVSETGTVERVRLLSTPKRMADMMLLSGAKNWEFEPALKDGQSVRYRLELSWAATP